MMACGPVEIVLVYQSLLGIYGDRGNATVLVKRLQWRGYDTTLTVVEPGDALPDTGQVYLLGGGEDAAQISAVNALRADGGLHRAVDRGAAVFAVCAGYQIIGYSFTVGERRRGDRGPRAARRDHHPRSGARGRGDPHPLARSRGGRRSAHRFREPRRLHPLGPSATPLARVEVGRRQRADGTEGASTAR